MNDSNTQKVTKNLADELKESPATAKRPLSSPEQDVLPANKKKMDKEYHSPDYSMDDVMNLTNENSEVHVFEKILRTIHAELTDIKEQNNNIKADLKSIKELQTQCNESIKELQTQCNELRDTVNVLSKQNDDQAEQITKLQTENSKMKKTITEQGLSIDEIDQYSRRQNVIFDSVKETDDENTTELVLGQCDRVGMAVHPRDIQVTHRLGQKTAGKTRPIIARFVSVNTSRTVLMKVKEQFRQKQDGKPNTPKQNVVHAREHLTSCRADILKKCLKLKKDSAIKSCWVYNFEVYVKKTKDDTKGIKMSSPDDLKKHGLHV